MLKVQVNGITIAFERRGSGAPLVLIHGYPLDHTIWEPVVNLLENKFDLILPDMRGFGGSESNNNDYSMADLAADVAGLLGALRIKQAFISGHSMGGYAALAFAHAFPGRVLGLGLVATQSVADTPEKKAGRLQEAGHILANGVGDVAAGMPPKLTADPDLQNRLKELILHQHPTALAGALRAMATRPESTPFLSEFDFLVLLIHGTADGLIPIERARQVQAAVTNGRLVEVEGTGHMPMMEAPEITAQALQTFLE